MPLDLVVCTRTVLHTVSGSGRICITMYIKLLKSVWCMYRSPVEKIILKKSLNNPVRDNKIFNLNFYDTKKKVNKVSILYLSRPLG